MIKLHKPVLTDLLYYKHSCHVILLFSTCIHNHSNPKTNTANSKDYNCSTLNSFSHCFTFHLIEDVRHLLQYTIMVEMTV